MDGFQLKLLDKIIGILGKNSPKIIKYLLKETPIEEFKKGIETHLQEVNNWSSTIQLFGLGANKTIDNDSISLRMHGTPRKFRGAMNNQPFEDENSFLMDSKHYLLLGDPGSGKTTTVKRLIRKVLFEEPTNDSDIYQYPILIRLKSFDGKLTLYEIIANALSIKHDTKRKQKTISGRKVTVYEKQIGKMPLESTIIAFLNETKPVIFLDGLDEVNPRYYNKIEGDIEDISNKLTHSKIILTCRSGQYLRNIEGLNTYEICPLTDEQISEIARLWVDNYDDFLERSSSLPYKDLLNRPLILCQIAILYNNNSDLPEKPSLIYKKIIELLLKEWDSQRKISRPSQYSKFDSDTKLEFLSELSYLLTYEIKKVRFSEDHLLACYKGMHDSFHLPENEAKEVVNEIEAHTGIIVESGFNYYEFSHLSLQEYLCANYLVREPLSDLLGEYLAKYPAPVAITIALASNPGHWFAALILRPNNINFISEESINILLSRIYLEKPFFKPDILFGMSILKLIDNFYRTAKLDSQDAFNRFYNMFGVKESLYIAISKHYRIEEYCHYDSNLLNLKKCVSIENDHGCITPFLATISVNILKNVYGDNKNLKYENGKRFIFNN